MRINAKRLLGNLRELATIGGTAEGGVTRLAFSDTDVAGRAWFREKVEAAGLVYHEDGAGNQSAILHSNPPSDKTVLCGSHLDTVTNGGRFDGALGVLAGLEALQTTREQNIQLPVNLELIAFTDEEGTMLGLFGSQAVAGMLTADIINNPRGGADALQEGMRNLGISAVSVMSAKRDPETLAGFVELHVEQGTRLIDQNIDVGVVTGIVGIRSVWVTFEGKAAHAGATPMAMRQDALWGAADFIQQARELIKKQFHPGVCNVGQISASPGAFNIVPERVNLALEFRHGTESLLDEMSEALCNLAKKCAADHQLTATFDEANRCVSAPAAEQIIGAIEGAADKLGLSHTRMMSFAGHDTQSMAKITPSAMIFAPSVDGVSHHPTEYTSDGDVINCANCLLHTLITMATR